MHVVVSRDHYEPLIDSFVQPQQVELAALVGRVAVGDDADGNARCGARVQRLYRLGVRRDVLLCRGIGGLEAQGIGARDVNAPVGEGPLHTQHLVVFLADLPCGEEVERAVGVPAALGEERVNGQVIGACEDLGVRRAIRLGKVVQRVIHIKDDGIGRHRHSPLSPCEC